MTTDIQALITQMTLEEKAALCFGASAWTTTPVERLGIPEMIVSDGPHGVRRVPEIHAMGGKSLPATCFPTASCLASTWDVNLIRQMGIALAEECIALNVELQPGESKSVSIQLDFRSFAYYHPKYKQWITEGGDFDVLIGASATDIHAGLTVTLESTIDLPCVLDEESTMREWLADSRGKAVFASYYSCIETEARKRFGGGGEDRYASEGAIGMDIMDMFNDMPLVSVLMFQKNAWDIHPEDMVGELLQQVHDVNRIK